MDSQELDVHACNRRSRAYLRMAKAFLLAGFRQSMVPTLIARFPPQKVWKAGQILLPILKDVLGSLFRALRAIDQTGVLAA